MHVYLLCHEYARFPTDVCAPTVRQLIFWTHPSMVQYLEKTITVLMPRLAHTMKTRPRDSECESACRYLPASTKFLQNCTCVTEVIKCFLRNLQLWSPAAMIKIRWTQWSLVQCHTQCPPVDLRKGGCHHLVTTTMNQRSFIRDLPTTVEIGELKHK